MLNEKNIEHVYREYTREPLSADEIRLVLAALDLPASAVLRRRDPAFKSLGLAGDEGDETLIAAMAEHPTLLQRPIGVVGTLGDGARAAVGRPPEALLDILP